MPVLTKTNIDKLEAALKRGLEETDGDLFKTEEARLRFIQRNYFPYGGPHDHWPAYNHWRTMISKKLNEVVLQS